jgi:hypothetical protein
LDPKPLLASLRFGMNSPLISPTYMRALESLFSALVVASEVEVEVEEEGEEEEWEGQTHE